MTAPSSRARRFVDWVIRRRALVFTVAALFTLAGGVRTVLTYGALRSDLAELLPSSAPSVAALDALRDRLPGLRHLGVVVDTGGPENADEAVRFLNELAERIRGYGPEVVEDVRTGISKERGFAETFALQLMDPSDVKGLRKAIEARRDWEVARATGTDLFLEDEPPAIPAAELRKKYEARYGTSAARFEKDHFVAPDGTTAVLVVQASSHDTGFDADADLLNRVQADIAALGFPDAYAPGMRVGFAGDVPTRVEEMRGLVADLSLSGALVGLLVIGVIVWFFRSARALPILFLPLFAGTLCTFGLVALPPLSIRHLNSNTAFLGSIVVGNGINTGIILLARFREERRRGRELRDAIAVAVEGTWRPTLAAAAAASAAYGSLVFTDFRGFNQFGWIGGVGMLTCWLATMLLVPPLLSVFAGSMGVSEALAGRHSAGRGLAALALRFPRGLVAATAVLTIASIAGMAVRSSDWLETDFSKLRRRDSWESGERYWGQRMDATLGRYLTPTVILADDAKDARLITARVNELKEAEEAGGLIASVRNVDSVLPKGRAESLEEAKRLADIVTPRLKQKLSDEERLLVERALSAEALEPLEGEAVPPVLAAGLRERSGRLDRNVIVFPKLTSGTWDADRMADYTRDLRHAASAGLDQPAPVAGSLLLSSDIVDAMKLDGPRATAIALAVVLVVAMAAFRSLSLSFAAIASLLVGVVLMLGALAWTGQRFNFSNFVALPITFGIAADYSINMLKRLQSDGSSTVGTAVVNTGGAVALCSATTIIGFGSLLVAQNQALFSFGVFAVAGEIACLGTALWFLPAALGLLGRFTPDGRGTESRVRSFAA